MENRSIQLVASYRPSWHKCKLLETFAKPKLDTVGPLMQQLRNQNYSTQYEKLSYLFGKLLMKRMVSSSKSDTISGDSNNFGFSILVINVVRLRYILLYTRIWFI